VNISIASYLASALQIWFADTLQNTVFKILLSLKEYLSHLREEFDNFEGTGSYKNDYQAAQVQSTCHKARINYG